MALMTGSRFRLFNDAQWELISALLLSMRVGVVIRSVMTVGSWRVLSTGTEPVFRGVICHDRSSDRSRRCGNVIAVIDSPSTRSTCLPSILNRSALRLPLDPVSQNCR
jgi:hypothetical protein